MSGIIKTSSPSRRFGCCGFWICGDNLGEVIDGDISSSSPSSTLPKSKRLDDEKKKKIRSKKSQSQSQNKSQNKSKNSKEEENVNVEMKEVNGNNMSNSKEQKTSLENGHNCNNTLMNNNNMNNNMNNNNNDDDGQDDGQDDEPKIRSVNDFDTTQSLREALKHKEQVQAFIEFGRDFIPPSKQEIPKSIMDDDSTSTEGGDFGVEHDPELDWVLTNFNAEISQAQNLEEELKRLLVLKSYLILDSEREARFERITALASRMFDVPIALVSLVDLGRQWFMSNRGLGDTRETPRRHAFCAHAIISKEDMLIVPNATLDARFCDNPLVTGPPDIRFYAGAPLLCPEGYRLGTLCVIDNKPRPDGLSLEQKQNLRELSSILVDAMVERRREKMRILQDKSQIIATTAHDLLTPLTGVQMSLSVLMDDEELKTKLPTSSRELLETAMQCGDMMNRICNQAIETFRGDVSAYNRSVQDNNNNNNTSKGNIVVADMVKNLHMVMEPYPKQVPLLIRVDPLVPPEFVGDDLKIFRSVINYLTNACKKTMKGWVRLNIYVGGKAKKPKLVFDCEDTGPGVPTNTYPYLFRPFREGTDGDGECIRVDDRGEVIVGKGNVSQCSTMTNSGLGLYSVANQISSIGGEYGFRPRQDDKDNVTGALFWFSVPLVVPSHIEWDVRKKKVALMEQKRASERLVMEDVELVMESAACDLGKKDDLQKIRVVSANATESSKVLLDMVVGGVIREEENRKKRAEGEMAATRVRRALVIDDSLVIRKSLVKAFSKLGYEVNQATNGLEGLKELQTRVYDVVLCDFLMPVMDGLDCVQQYREWETVHRPWFHQYIVGISAHASMNDVSKGQKAGMDDFKAKPVTMKYLKELDHSDKLSDIAKELDAVLCIRDNPKEPTRQSRSAEAPRKKVRFMGRQPVCLIGEDASQSVSKPMREVLDRRGWNTVLVQDGEDALRLLKMRNWDAVFLDHEMPRLTGTRCVVRFRDWEGENRVARQANMIYLSTAFIPSPAGSNTSTSYPNGFDGALGKPVLVHDLVALLEQAESCVTESCQSSSIVAR